MTDFDPTAWGAVPVDKKFDPTAWGAVPVDQGSAQEPARQMPSFGEALWSGATESVKELGQTAQTFRGEKPQVHEQSPAAAGFEWSDLSNPWSQGLPKVAYGLGKSAPSLAAGIAGGTLGGAAGSLAGPVGTTVGAIGGGAAGAGAMSAVQALGPSFAEELKKTPNDPDGAYNRALRTAEISGAFSGLGWAVFPAKFFQGPVKNLLFQSFGVQPAVSVAGQATQNVVAGKPVSEGLGQAYAQGAVGTVVPALGTHAVGAILKGRGKAEEAPAAVETPAAQAPTPTVPETPETLAKQQADLVDSDHPRKAQLFPQGTDELPLPDKMERTEIPDGVVHYDPERISEKEIKSAAAENRMNDVLDLGPVSKDEAIGREQQGEKPVAVTERTPEGDEVKAAAGTEDTAPDQIKALEDTKSPENTVQTEPVEETLAGRVTPKQLPDGFYIVKDRNTYFVRQRGAETNEQGTPISWSVARSQADAIAQFYQSHPKYAPNAPRTAAEAFEQFDKATGYPSEIDQTANDNARSSGPPGGGEPPSPPVPPGPSKGPEDNANFARRFRSMTDWWKKTFQPELVSDKALQADPLFARYRSASAQEKDQIVHSAEEGYQFWRKVPQDQSIEFLGDIETGKPVDPQFSDFAIRYRSLLNEAYRAEKEYGSKAGFVQDYFPHIWKDPQAARAFADSMTASLGPKWFQKARYYDLIQEGLKAGLELKSANPEDLVTMRLLSGVDMRQRVELLRQLQDLGLATKAAGNEHRLSRQGWQAINAPDREQWLIAPDAQPLWENAVNAKGLWSNEGVPGTVFRGWMSLKNAWVPIKLALSAFHPLHVLHINYANGMAQAWRQLTNGHPVTALKRLGQGFTDPIVAAIPGAPFIGKEARAAWVTPKAERTPEQNAMIDLMNDGGFVPQLSEQLKIAAKRKLEQSLDQFQSALGNKQLGSAAWQGTKMGWQTLRRSIEVMQAPVFEKWIPSLKAAAYMHEASDLLARRPELLDDPIQKRAALRTIAKSVDNRFGEMFYSNLFWNRYIKDAGIGSFLSLGWNLGFAREFGGGLLEPLGRKLIDLKQKPSETRATIRDAGSKLPFVIAYTTSAMAINGMMTYLFSGQTPEGMDWFLPRIGGTNPDGTPRRVTNMFYTREIPMAKKHIEEKAGNIPAGLGAMLWNKLMFQPFAELYNNKTYFGTDIRDEDAPLYKQVGQVLHHIAVDQMSPITVSGSNRAIEKGGTYTKDVPLAMLGFSPAPSYAERTATQNRIMELFRRHVAPESRPVELGAKYEEQGKLKNQILIAKQSNDKGRMDDLRKEWFSKGFSRQGYDNIFKGVTSDMTMFQRLPPPDQRNILRNAPKAEAKKYIKYANKKIIQEFPDLR